MTLLKLRQVRDDKKTLGIRMLKKMLRERGARRCGRPHVRGQRAGNPSPPGSRSTCSSIKIFPETDQLAASRPAPV